MTMGVADEEWICSVCRSDESDEHNPLIICDGCNACVHRECYGNPLCTSPSLPILPKSSLVPFLTSFANFLLCIHSFCLRSTSDLCSAQWSRSPRTSGCVTSAPRAALARRVRCAPRRRAR